MEKIKLKNIILIIISVIVLIIIMFFTYNKIKYNSISKQLSTYDIQTEKKSFLIFPTDVAQINKQYQVINVEYDLFKEYTNFILSTLNINISEEEYAQDNYNYMVKILKENKNVVDESFTTLSTILEDERLKKIANNIKNLTLKTEQDFLEYLANMMLFYEYINIKYSMDDIINTIIKDVHLGFVYWNPNTDDMMKQNEDEIYLAASTYKLGVALQIADGVNSTKYSLDDKVDYKSIDYEGGAGIIQYEPYGTTYTIDELLQIMIHYSDNVAAHMLIRYIGEDNYQKFMDEVTNNNYTFNGNEITPQAGFYLVKKLYVNEENNPVYDDLISYMENTVYEDRISLYIDNDIVAHKIGDYGIYTNDIGIVFGNNPFVVSYYCQGVSEACKQSIGELSYIFTYYSSINNKK